MAFQTTEPFGTFAHSAARDAFWSHDLGIFRFGTPAAESLGGTNFDDTLIGGGGGDTLSGGLGHDLLIGGQGGDQFILGDVSLGDVVAGGGGVDTLILRPDDFASGQQTYSITAGPGGGLDISGGAVNGVERLSIGGGLAGDHITVTGDLSASGLAKDGYAITFTNNGAAILDLSGMTGSDIGVAFYAALKSNFSDFKGGAGDDYFYLGSRYGGRAEGGAGDDIFQLTAFKATLAFAPGSGHDTVEGFRPEGAGHVLDLAAYGFHDLEQVLAATSATQDGAVIHLGGENDITLVGVSLPALNTGDFIFG